MYTREKLCRDQTHKSRKPHKNPPSFSSSLLDQIYRSIDANVEASRISRRHGGGGYEEKEIASFRRACLVEKWMEKEADDNAAAKKRQGFLEDSDLVFFSSTSNSSDDSSGALSSSDTELFAPTHASRQKVSCFAARPNPVRTKAGSTKHDDSEDCDRHRNDDVLINSKFRALKIYANLKKVKQPISPGGGLTSFINSLFNHTNGKKSRKPDAGHEFPDVKSPKACSSVSSFSRSCLSKYSPRSREKQRSGAPRTVRFEPISVIVDEDLNKKVERAMPDSGVKGYSNKRNNTYFNDDKDCLSDSSSDLFELDHLSLFGSEELPVYETTQFDTNCGIASGLIQ